MFGMLIIILIEFLFSQRVQHLKKKFYFHFQDYVDLIIWKVGIKSLTKFVYDILFDVQISDFIFLLLPTKK